MDLLLLDRVVLVTGGTDGLGAALAERLVAERARVAVCGRDPERLDAVRDRLSALGGDVLAVQADVRHARDVEHFVAAAHRRWGRIDGLVNNAGTSAAHGIEAVGDDEWAADLDLKLVAAARMTRLVLPHLRAGGGGAIVNVLAVSAKSAPAGSLPTSASRAAGLALTKSLSKELGPASVRVNAILVGYVESGQWRRRAEAQGTDVASVYAELVAVQDIPLGRVGRAEEFADLAAFLLSERAGYVTGSAVNLDGGLSPAV